MLLITITLKSIELIDKTQTENIGRSLFLLCKSIIVEWYISHIINNQKVVGKYIEKKKDYKRYNWTDYVLLWIVVSCLATENMRNIKYKKTC